MAIESNEKLRVIGSLTRHDIRNKLSAINGQCYILKKKNANAPEIVNGVFMIEQSVNESTRILPSSFLSLPLTSSLLIKFH